VGRDERHSARHSNRELVLHASLSIRELVELAKRGVEVGERLDVCGALDRALGCSLPLNERLFVQTGLGVMVGEELGLVLRRLGKVLLQDARDLPMEEVPPALEQRVVCGVANEGVLEDVGRARRDAALVQDLRRDELRESLFERLVVQRRHARDHLT
jgi:hypothetical protein